MELKKSIEIQAFTAQLLELGSGTPSALSKLEKYSASESAICLFSLHLALAR